MTSSGVLAIEGGKPVRSHPMPARDALGADAEKMIAECLAYYRDRNEDPGYQGRFETRYCEAFVATQGGGFADAVATGTSAVFLALAALMLHRGAEVICSPVTDPGTLSAIILNGLVPRLADSAPGRYNMDVAQFAARITPRVKAVVVVHSLGCAADIAAIVDCAARHGIKVVEDCSQSHGACVEGRPIGTFGDIAAFSTMYRKAHITGGSGGVVYTRDEHLHRMALAHADRGKPRWLSDFDDRNPSGFLFPALNFHTDELSCAIGIASLGRLKGTIRRRLAFVRDVSSAIESHCTICRPYGYSENDSPFVYPVVVDRIKIRCSVTDFAKAVRAEGIGLNPNYSYVASQWPFLQPHLADAFATPNACAIRDGSFCLYLNENYGVEEAQQCALAMAKVERALALS